jgi:hypothetical protein
MNQVMSVLDMDLAIAEYALLSVRYRSAEEAISQIIEPEFGFYRHPFINYSPKQDKRDLESGSRSICLLC